MPVVQSKIFIAHATRVLLFCFRPVLVSVNLRPLQPDTQEEPARTSFFYSLAVHIWLHQNHSHVVLSVERLLESIAFLRIIR